MKKTMIKIEASLLAAFILCCLLNITSFSKQCDGIREKILRMHVIANSDSEEDQQLKLKVRDAVLSKGKELFDGSVTSSDAERKLSPYIDELESTAESVIKNNGYDYDVKIIIGKDYFKTRVYDNSVTLPAGEYTAVKVIIGDGAGKNWWCVMFPPMCLPASDEKCELSDVLNSEENDVVNNGRKYKIKFKFVEIYEEIIKKIK